MTQSAIEGLGMLLNAALLLAGVWLIHAISTRLYDWWRECRDAHELGRHLAEAEHRRKTGRLG